MRKSRLLIGIVTGALVLLGAVILAIIPRSGQVPLSEGEINQLETALGVVFPPGTRAIRTWFDWDSPAFDLRVRVECSKTDVAELLTSARLTSEHEIPIDKGVPYFDHAGYLLAKQKQWRPTPLRSTDQIFLKKFPTTLPVESSLVVLARIDNESATLYFRRDGHPDELFPSLISALSVYNLDESWIPSQGGLFGRQWP